MWNFIKSLLSNRFGIVLASLNLCYFLSRDFMISLFEHNRGENCIFSSYSVLMPWGNPGILNLPALLASALSSEIITSIFPSFCVFTHAKLQLTITAFFVVFQWLFIGWVAKTIAQKFSKK